MMEAMLGCGNLRSLSFQSQLYRVPLPSSDQDFVFGVCSENELQFLEVLDLEASDSPKIQNLGGHGYEIDFTLIIQGFNIWSEVSRWVSSTKRTERPPASRNIFLPNDPFWSRSLVVLEDWRDVQSSRVHFSAGKSHLPAFLSRRQGERYAFVNLIYFSTSIFLHRESLAFMADKSASPSGDTEPVPSIQHILPDGWKSSVERLVESAYNTIQLIRQLLHHGIDLQVPFTCHCVFNATIALFYAKKCPEVVPGRFNCAELFDWGAEWISRASEIWGVARVWRTTLENLTSLQINSGNRTTNLMAPCFQSLPHSPDLRPSLPNPLSPSVEQTWPAQPGLEEVRFHHQQNNAIPDDLGAIWDSLIAYPVQAFPLMDDYLLNVDSDAPSANDR